MRPRAPAPDGRVPLGCRDLTAAAAAAAAAPRQRASETCARTCSDGGAEATRLGNWCAHGMVSAAVAETLRMVSAAVAETLIVAGLHETGGL